MIHIKVRAETTTYPMNTFDCRSCLSYRRYVTSFLRYPALPHLPLRINWGQGAMTLKDGSKGAKRDHATTKRPKMAQNGHIPRYNKKTNHFYAYKISLLLTCFSVPLKSTTYFTLPFRNWGTSVKFGLSRGTLSGSAIDDIPSFRRNFYKKGCVGRPAHPTPLQSGPVASSSLSSRRRKSASSGSSPQ